MKLSAWDSMSPKPHVKSHTDDRLEMAGVRVGYAVAAPDLFGGFDSHLMWG